MTNKAGPVIPLISSSQPQRTRPLDPADSLSPVRWPARTSDYPQLLSPQLDRDTRGPPPNWVFFPDVPGAEKPERTSGALGPLTPFLSANT